MHPIVVTYIGCEPGCTWLLARALDESPASVLIMWCPNRIPHTSKHVHMFVRPNPSYVVRIATCLVCTLFSCGTVLLIAPLEAHPLDYCCDKAEAVMPSKASLHRSFYRHPECASIPGARCQSRSGLLASNLGFFGSDLEKRNGFGGNLQT